MINKYFDLSFKTVGAVLLVGVSFVIVHMLLSFASVVLEQFPSFIRHFLVFGGSYAVAIFCLWKFSEIQGRKLEQEHRFDLKEQVCGSCVGVILDTVLVFVLFLVPTIGTIFFKLHNYGMFPGFIFEYYGGIDHNSAIVIGILINIPIFAAVRIYGLVCGKKAMIYHRECIEELARKNSEGFSNSKSGRSWKESVGNATANRSDFLKNKNDN